MDDAQHRTAQRAFREAVARADGQSGFARLTGAKQQNISNWLRAGKLLPGDFVLAAERGTGVSKHLLRPDIYPLDPEPAAASTAPLSYAADRPPVRSNDAPVSDRSPRA